jgi:hypothetical protein
VNTASLFRSRRVVAPALHLLGSAGVAALAAVLVFAVWYPAPYASLTAGLSMFVLLVSVDVVLGPTLTAVAADPAKPAKVLRRDIAVIVVLQLAGLAYGIYSLSLGRPVYLAFEVDRLRVVTAADVDESTLDQAPPEFRSLPWSGPRLIAAVRPTRPDEVLRSIDMALAGVDISMVPSQWRDYASQKDAVLRIARPATELQAKYPEAAPELEHAAARAHKAATELRFLPVLSRNSSAVALIDPSNAGIVGFLPFDGFF